MKPDLCKHFTAWLFWKYLKTHMKVQLKNYTNKDVFLFSKDLLETFIEFAFVSKAALEMIALKNQKTLRHTSKVNKVFKNNHGRFCFQ